jgi:hypothetical protein
MKASFTRAEKRAEKQTLAALFTEVPRRRGVLRTSSVRSSANFATRKQRASNTKNHSFAGCACRVEESMLHPARVGKEPA